MPPSTAAVNAGIRNATVNDAGREAAALRDGEDAGEPAEQRRESPR